ncbi:hypothetical protein SUGI_0465230 [Cryptomeria japonica]|nr:hypothetical protein SUGI_0465230 [Cryptomeria japonica]
MEFLSCSVCRSLLGASGECNCSSDTTEGEDVELYRHNFIEVIKACISTGVPNQSGMSVTDLPFHVRVEDEIINEICLYRNSTQIYVKRFCDKYPITPSQSSENERARNDSRQSYTLPVRLMYRAPDGIMQPQIYPDSIIQIPGDGLNWHQILVDVESNIAELQWRKINLAFNSSFYYEYYMDYERHVQGTGGVNPFRLSFNVEIIGVGIMNDVDIRGPPPAGRSAVENLERETIEENRDFLCCICQAILLAGEKCVKMPCNHEYHEGCILQWLATSNFCPACKYELPTDDPDYEAQKQRRNG